MWIGTAQRIEHRVPQQPGHFDYREGWKNNYSLCDIRHISQDKEGNIWLATDNEGIIRISGNASNPKSLRFKQYSPAQQNFDMEDATACLEDSKGKTLGYLQQRRTLPI